MPLNIDLQQILLHWMNLAILTGGLYFLLYKPVKQFMAQREEHYRQLDREADEKLAQARQTQAEYQARLDGAEAEIRDMRAKAQQSVQQSAQEQLDQAQEQAQEIVAQARADAERERDQLMRRSQRELKDLTAKAAKKLAAHPEADPFEQFLNLAEGGKRHENR